MSVSLPAGVFVSRLARLEPPSDPRRSYGRHAPSPRPIFSPARSTKAHSTLAAATPFVPRARCGFNAVLRSVKQELVDGYFGQGERQDLDHRVADWMDRLSPATRKGFLREGAPRELRRVAERTRHLCDELALPFPPAPTLPGCRDEPPPPKPSVPTPDRKSSTLRGAAARSQAVHEAVEQASKLWSDPPTGRTARHQVSDGPRSTRFVDYLRFRAGVERALREVARLYVEGLVDEPSITAGAHRAFHETARYLRRRADANSTIRRRLSS